MGTDRAREQRFIELVAANRPRIERIARAYARSDAADLQQEILLQVWRGLDSFEGRSSAATWLYRVALNTAMTWRRQRGSGSAASSVATKPLADTPGEVSPRDPLQVLDDFLATLTAIDRAILLLYLEDSSYREIADVTGLSEGNVGVRINRMKRAFIERYIGER